MSGRSRIFGVAAIVICAVTLYGSLEQPGRSLAADPSALLEALRRSMAGSGLYLRDDVSIKLNGREVALGFSRPGCNGLMLVAVLPHTAQGWAHMAPRLDLSAYDLGYLYQGEMHPSVPRLERLAGRLWGELGLDHPGTSPRVVAIAESGHCGLAPRAAPALEAVSRGRWPPAGPVESPLTIGDAST